MTDKDESAGSWIHSHSLTPGPLAFADMVIKKQAAEIDALRQRVQELEQLQHLHRMVETEWQDRYDAMCKRKDALLREALRALKYHSDQTRPIEQTFDMMDAIKMELSK